MVFFRQLSYLSLTPLPVLKQMSRHSLSNGSCLHNVCNNVQQMRCSSLCHHRKKIYVDGNASNHNDQFVVVSKQLDDIEGCSQNESLSFTNTRLHSVPEVNSCFADDKQRNQRINDKQTSRKESVLKENLMSEDEFKNIFYNDVISSTNSWNTRLSKFVSNNLKNSDLRDFLQKFHQKHDTVLPQCQGHQTCHNCRSGLPWLQHHQNHRTSNGLLCSWNCASYSSYRSSSTASTQSKQAKRWKILFFGTDNFAVEILRILNENRLSTTGSVVEALDVVSNAGKTSVRKYADGCSLDVFTWPTCSLDRDYDVGVLASFGHLIPARLINSFPHGILNIHPSLLPRWRGSAPIIHTILNGDDVTGVSIMKLKAKRFDIGLLLAQKEFSVPARIKSCKLSDFLSRQGAQMLIECLSNLTSFENSEFEQSTDGVTLAQKLKPNMSNIKWNEQTCVEIDRHHRAFGELIALRSHWNNLTVKLRDMVDPTIVKDMADDPSYGLSLNAVPGTPVFSKERQLLLIKCKDGWVGFQTIIIKKKMSAKAFYNGYLSKVENKDTIFR